MFLRLKIAVQDRYDSRTGEYQIKCAGRFKRDNEWVEGIFLIKCSKAEVLKEYGDFLIEEAALIREERRWAKINKSPLAEIYVVHAPDEEEQDFLTL